MNLKHLMTWIWRVWIWRVCYGLGVMLPSANGANTLQLSLHVLWRNKKMWKRREGTLKQKCCNSVERQLALFGSNCSLGLLYSPQKFQLPLYLRLHPPVSCLCGCFLYIFNSLELASMFYLVLLAQEIWSKALKMLDKFSITNLHPQSSSTYNYLKTGHSWLSDIACWCPSTVDEDFFS